VHTRRDSADQLAIAGFERAGQVALKVIQALLDSPEPQRPCQAPASN